METTASSLPENQGMRVLQVPKQFVSKCLHLKDGNKGTSVLLTRRKVMPLIKAMSQVYCKIYEGSESTLYLIQRPETCLAHPRLSFPLRVSIALALFPCLFKWLMNYTEEWTLILVIG